MVENGENQGWPGTDPDEKLSVKAATVALGVSRRTIYNYEKRGWLRIEHEHNGKPFIRRGQIDLVLRKKGDQVAKGKFLPEGHITVEEDRYNAAMRRLDFLEQERPKLLTYQEEVEADRQRIAELEAELEKREKAGLVKRLFKKW